MKNEIQLMHGDCLERMTEIPDGSVDMVLCDLPYGTTACKWDSVIPFEPLWAHYKRIAKKNAGIVLTASQPFTSALVMSNTKMFKYCWVWDKVKPSGFQIAKFRPMMQHEDVAVFCHGTPSYFPIKTPRIKPKMNAFRSPSESSPLAYSDGKARVYTDHHPKSILTVSNANQRNRYHPTQKPVALMEYLIRTYTNEGEIVLDNTMGSGTTGVACVNTNRSFIGIEQNEEYFNIAKARIEAAKTLI